MREGGSLIRSWVCQRRTGFWSHPATHRAMVTRVLPSQMQVPQDVGCSYEKDIQVDASKMTITQRETGTGQQLISAGYVLPPAHDRNGSSL